MTAVEELKVAQTLNHWERWPSPAHNDVCLVTTLVDIKYVFIFQKRPIFYIEVVEEEEKENCFQNVTVFNKMNKQ